MSWTPQIRLIVAHDKNFLVGVYDENENKHKMPWHISSDLQWFKKITAETEIVIGRSTWESFACTPLPGRNHIVVTSIAQQDTDQVRFMSYHQMLDTIKTEKHKTFSICGGPTLYNAVLGENIVTDLFVSEIESAYEIAEHHIGTMYNPRIDIVLKDFKMYTIVPDVNVKEGEPKYTITHLARIGKSYFDHMSHTSLKSVRPQ